MSEPPKPESRRVESNETLGSSDEKIIQDVKHVSKESVVRTSTVESKIGGHDRKVGIWLCSVSVAE
jgi:uncharacterized protein YpuA (DUF1002 family)